MVALVLFTFVFFLQLTAEEACTIADFFKQSTHKKLPLGLHQSLGLHQFDIIKFESQIIAGKTSKTVTAEQYDRSVNKKRRALLWSTSAAVVISLFDVKNTYSSQPGQNEKDSPEAQHYSDITRQAVEYFMQLEETNNIA